MNEPSFFSQIIMGLGLVVLSLATVPLVVLLIGYAWGAMIIGIKDLIEDYKYEKKKKQRGKAVQMKEDLFKLIKDKFINR